MKTSKNGARAGGLETAGEEKSGLLSTPWFGNIAIMCGGVSVALLLALGVWTDGGMGELSGGLRSKTLSGSSPAVTLHATRRDLARDLERDLDLAWTRLGPGTK